MYVRACCVYVYACGYMFVTCVDIRGQLVGDVSLCFFPSTTLLLWIELMFQSSWQALLTAEPSCCPIDLQLNLCAIEDFFEITKLGMVTRALDPTNQLFQFTKKTWCEFYRLGVY